MNILVVTQYFWPENFRINDLVEGMIARGHMVTVLTGQPNYPAGKFFAGYGWHGTREESYHGARVLRVPLIARGVCNPLRLFLNYISFVFFGLWAVLFRIPKSTVFDTIFVFEVSPVTVGIPAAAARYKFKAPMLFWVLDLWPESLRAVGAVTHPVALWPVEVLVRWIYKRCDRILVASRAFIPEVVRYGGATKSIRYFPNWGEQIFDAPPTEVIYENLPDLPSGTRIVYTGNIGEAQDFMVVLDAAERLRDRSDIQWIIVGDGRMAPWLRNEIMRLNLQSTVTLIPQQPLERMPAYFAAADALFLSLKPDPIFEKTIPGKLQSYLAAAKPVLAMLDGEGAAMLAESGAGLCCPAGDAAALVETVTRFVAMSKAEHNQMGTAARHYYENNFRRDHVFNALEGWMQELAVEGIKE